MDALQNSQQNTFGPSTYACCFSPFQIGSLMSYPVSVSLCCQHVWAWFSISRYALYVAIRSMCVDRRGRTLYGRSAFIRDGLRLEAIAADIAGDDDTPEMLSIGQYSIAVLDRDISRPLPGDEIAKQYHRPRQRHA